MSGSLSPWGVGGCIVFHTLDGNNHNIYNMIWDNANSSSITHNGGGGIRNVNFVNMIFKNNTQTTRNIITGTFYNCNFGIFLSNSSPAGCLFYTNKFYDCSFNIRGDLGGYGCNFSRTHFYRCHINLNVMCSTEYAIRGDAGSYRCYLYDSCITGKVHTQLNVNSACITYIYMNNSYLALEFTKNQVLLDASLAGVNFVVNDIGKGYVNLSSSIKSLTSEQAKDPEYLQSIGFLTL